MCRKAVSGSRNLLHQEWEAAVNGGAVNGGAREMAEAEREADAGEREGPFPRLWLKMGHLLLVRPLLHLRPFIFLYIFSDISFLGSTLVRSTSSPFLKEILFIYFF